jgi:hypothetical protein
MKASMNPMRILESRSMMVFLNAVGRGDAQ